MKKLSILFVLCLPAFAANTYYVSKSIGNDANTTTQAKSKSTPWQHIPFMCNAVGCNSYSPVADDTFVLMGCDVWVQADLPVMWNASGTSGHPITITVDKTWFNATNCPTNWNRPIWDLQGTSSTDHTIMIRPGAQTNTHDVVLDNIEMKGLSCSGTCNGAQAFIQCNNGCTNWTFSNNYFHAWKINFDNQCAALQSAPNSPGTIFTANVVDGSDSSPQGTCTGIFPTWPSQITNNVFHDMPNMVVGSAGTGNTSIISGNAMYNATLSNGRNHCNLMEVTGGGTHYIHDNSIHSATCSGGEAMMVGSNGENSFIYNNLIYDIINFQAPNFPQTGGQAIVGLHFWNNTIVANTGSPCFYNSNQQGGSLTTLVIQNNHCITTNGSATGNFSGIAITSSTIDHNTLMTPTTATTQGYTSAETFVYSPISTCTGGTCSTLTAGTSLAGSCSGNLTSLCTDTTYAASQQTINGVVQAVAPNRTTNARGGSPDTGAYQFVTLSGPGFSASPNPVTFGNVNVGSSGGPTTVTITNTGTTNLVITSVTSGNARFAVSSNTCGTVTAGNTCTFAVTFSPLAPGAQNATIGIADNAGNPDLVSATGTGVAVGPGVQLSPTLLAFGSQIVGTTSAGLTTTLTNSGNATLNITSILSNDAQFVKSATTCGSTLTAGNSCTVTVTFRPSSSGTQNASLTFTTNAASSPDVVSLSGVGTFMQFINQQSAVTTSGSNVFTFIYTPAAVGNALVIGTYCHASSGTVGTISISASGWTFIQSVAPTSNTVGKGALFSAVAPSTSLATFTVTFGSVTDCSAFSAYLAREVTGNDPTGGATTFNATGSSGGASGGCNQGSADVTPPLANEGIAFFCIDGSNSVNAPYNLGAFDNIGDVEGDQLLVGGAGIAQAPNFVTSGAYIVMGVAISPLQGLPPVAPAGSLFAGRERTKGNELNGSSTNSARKNHDE